MLMIFLTIQMTYVLPVGQSIRWRVRGPVVKFSSLWHFVMRADLEKWYINDTELSEMRDIATAPRLSTVVRSTGIAKYCCLL